MIAIILAYFLKTLRMAVLISARLVFDLLNSIRFNRALNAKVCSTISTVSPLTVLASFPTNDSNYSNVLLNLHCSIRLKYSLQTSLICSRVPSEIYSCGFYWRTARKISCGRPQITESRCSIPTVQEPSNCNCAELFGTSTNG